VRAVLDPNVLIASLLSREGAAARLESSWLSGAFEVVVTESLLEELERAPANPSCATASVRATRASS
jgi:predicted nucleic acid-binding protein